MSETKSQMLKDMEAFNNWKNKTRLFNFRTICVSVKTFVDGCEQGLYDLNPQHQRNVVHNDKWQSDIVLSVFHGMPLSTPEFDTCQHTKGDNIGCEYFRSLDGKQRLSSIARMVHGDYPMVCNDKLLKPLINGKTFDEWPVICQNCFLNKQFSIAITEAKLTDEEVSSYFDKKQNTKKTSTGEAFNAILTPRVDIIRNMTRTLPYPEYKVSNDKRHVLLELTTRSIWVCINKDSINKIDPNKTTLQRFLKEQKDNDNEMFREYQEKITPIISLIANFENPITNQWSKTNIIPLIYLGVKYHNNLQRVIVFINSQIQGNNTFFEIVGGNHNASTKRCEYIIKKYNEYWNDI